MNALVFRRARPVHRLGPLAVLLALAASAPADPEPAAEGAAPVTLDQFFPRDRVLDVRIEVAEEDWDTRRHRPPTRPAP